MLLCKESYNERRIYRPCRINRCAQSSEQARIDTREPGSAPRERARRHGDERGAFSPPDCLNSVGSAQMRPSRAPTTVRSLTSRWPEGIGLRREMLGHLDRRIRVNMCYYFSALSCGARANLWSPITAPEDSSRAQTAVIPARTAGYR